MREGALTAVPRPRIIPSQQDWLRSELDLVRPSRRVHIYECQRDMM